MIKNIQQYVEDYKIEASHGFYYLSKDGVSRFHSKEEYESLIGSDNLNYNFLYKKCFELLKYDLQKQQNEHSWIKDAFGIVSNFGYIRIEEPVELDVSEIESIDILKPIITLTRGKTSSDFLVSLKAKESKEKHIKYLNDTCNTRQVRRKKERIANKLANKNME